MGRVDVKGWEVERKEQARSRIFIGARRFRGGDSFPLSCSVDTALKTAMTLGGGYLAEPPEQHRRAVYFPRVFTFSPIQLAVS